MSLVTFTHLLASAAAPFQLTSWSPKVLGVNIYGVI